MIADKPMGMLHVFHADGGVMAQSAALYGKDIGDVMKALSSLAGGKRITPAGTFTLEARVDREYTGGMNFVLAETRGGQGVIAIHVVWLGEAKEQRAQPLASPSPKDNRISYGCINTTKEAFLNNILPNVSELNGAGLRHARRGEQDRRDVPQRTETTTTTETVSSTALPGNVSATTSRENLPGREQKLRGAQRVASLFDRNKKRRKKGKPQDGGR